MGATVADEGRSRLPEDRRVHDAVHRGGDHFDEVNARRESHDRAAAAP
ncbi:hypothetical protein OG389_22045 [Streptomyces sp. NBC_00435]